MKFYNTKIFFHNNFLFPKFLLNQDILNVSFCIYLLLKFCDTNECFIVYNLKHKLDT